MQTPSHKKKPCNFKISGLSRKTCKNTGKKHANFRVSIDDHHAFFSDFPISFKFYSNLRFKSRIQIRYSTAKHDDYEKILNKVIEFETHTKEHVHYINDIIVGQIYIRIESDSEYGDPIIEFEILKNSYCKLLKTQKLVIDFSKF